ncbi:deoxyribonuclease-1 [Biomphalaria pfeifferi]|uniref:Deoxyribonuclease n=1 Tax=Biomphalaria pfeifferi TaxID=112525 RepID=A0AAD8EVC2_BIOPF|nr:deoxyribonuclease-1 [Biomphalaria pfeifferi]
MPSRSAWFFLFLSAIFGSWVITSGQKSNQPIKIAAFNIKGFGRAKMTNGVTAGYIQDIVGRYDIILIQEVRDTTGFALNKLWTGLNRTDSWGLTVSGLVGRTNYKEQYAFFYRTKKIKVTGSFQYDDKLNDLFEREPFAIEIEYTSAKRSSKSRVVLLALHTKPQDTIQELKSLPQAMRAVYGGFKRAKGIIALGDLNADCSYLSNAMKKQMEIFQSDGDFVSIIPDTEDTTVAAGTNCAYDRAIILGQDVKVSDAGPYRFDSELGLEVETALTISDHYPIAFNLY